MSVKVRIKAVREQVANSCVGCFMDELGGCTAIIDDLQRLGVPRCGEGFIYILKVKEPKAVTP